MEEILQNKIRIDDFTLLVPKQIKKTITGNSEVKAAVWSVWDHLVKLFVIEIDQSELHFTIGLDFTWF